MQPLIAAQARLTRHPFRSGTVDECNAAIGTAVSVLSTAPADSGDVSLFISQLQTVQNLLFDLGAHLATPRSNATDSKIAKTQFPASASTELEEWIDAMDAQLDPLTTFVLPGGHASAAALHVARTVARRAERLVTPLYLDKERGIAPAAYRFLNRLSDYLFVASRFANMLYDCPDVKWVKRKE